jgi:hypothetical protein
MKAKIAVATVSGKAYYLIVSQLKKLGISFLSLTPYEPIPLDVRVVITTEKERPLIHHENVLSLRDESELPTIINQALKLAEGKSFYEKIVIGVDPGEVFGLAVLADGKVIGAENCFSMDETLSKIDSLLKSLRDVEVSSFVVKVGDGIPEYKDKILIALDRMLPSDIVLESVSEEGTNLSFNEGKHRRGLRDIGSAIKIAMRNGYVFPRGSSSEHNG